MGWYSFKKQKQKKNIPIMDHNDKKKKIPHIYIDFKSLSSIIGWCFDFLFQNEYIGLIPMIKKRLILMTLIDELP